MFASFTIKSQHLFSKAPGVVSARTCYIDVRALYRSALKNIQRVRSPKPPCFPTQSRSPPTRPHPPTIRFPGRGVFPPPRPPVPLSAPASASAPSAIRHSPTHEPPRAVANANGVNPTVLLTRVPFTCVCNTRMNLLLELGGHLGGLGLHVLDAADHVERALREVVVLARQDRLEARNGVLQ